MFIKNQSINHVLYPSTILAGSGFRQGIRPAKDKLERCSHSLAYKKFQDFSRTPKTFFQDSVVAQQCQITDKQQLLTMYIQCDSTIHRKTLSQVAKKLFG